MPAEVSDRELRLLWMRSQGLVPGEGSKGAAAAVKSALAIQAQDITAAALGIRARTEGLTEAKAARQSAADALSRAWLMRNTVFLFATSDLAWMRPLLADRPMARAVKRMGELGFPGDRLDAVVEALRERVAEGPIPRAEVAELVEAMGAVRDEGSAPVYWALHTAGLHGVLVQRPALDRDQFFVPGPEPEELTREKALGRLARRYLAAFGPASREDFAYFFKGSKGDANLAWDNAGRTVDVETSRGTLTALPRALDAPAPVAPVVRMLPSWDHFLLGWSRGRELTVPAGFEKAVHPGAGHLHPAFVVDGMVAGTWRFDRKRSPVGIVAKPFRGLTGEERAALEAEAEDVRRFLGLEDDPLVVEAPAAG